MLYTLEKKRSPRLPVKGKKVIESVRKKPDRFFSLQILADLLNHIPDPRQTEGLDPHLIAFVGMVRDAVYSVRFPEGGKTLLTGYRPKGKKPRLDPPLFGLAVAAREFNRLAQEFPGPLHLQPYRDTEGKREWIPTVRPPGRVGFLLWIAWDQLFRQKGWERLRECINCRTWFVDRGRNKQARWCSRACTNRWWTRDRRRRLGGEKRKKPGPAPRLKGRAGHARKGG